MKFIVLLKQQIHRVDFICIRKVYTVVSNDRMILDTSSPKLIKEELLDSLESNIIDVLSTIKRVTKVKHDTNAVGVEIRKEYFTKEFLLMV